MSGSRTKAVIVGAELFFRSKVAATAEAAGAEVIFAASAAELASALQAGGVGIVVINLEAASPDPIAAIAAAKSSGARTAGYANHVQEALMTRARDAGCDRVLAKGAFTRELHAILAGRDG